MKIHLAKLHPEVGESDLRQLLEPYGEVRGIRFLGPEGAADPEAVVDMEGSHAAAEVVRHRLQGTVLHGKPLFVDVVLFD
jgi:hypothetical protein